VLLSLHPNSSPVFLSLLAYVFAAVDKTFFPFSLSVSVAPPCLAARLDFSDRILLDILSNFGRLVFVVFAL
jgi:hypothetical protein